MRIGKRHGIICAGMALTLICTGCAGQPSSATGNTTAEATSGTPAEATYDTNKVLARWSIGDKSGEVLAGEVDRGMSVDGKDADPSADIVLERARTEVIASQATEQASDAEALAWLTDAKGYTDIASWARSLQVEDAAALECARTAATSLKWLAKQAGTPDNLTLSGKPTLPEAPSGKDDMKTRTEGYLNYIKSLAGNEYDNKEAGWSELVKGEGGATYEEAVSAYSKAYDKWANARFDAQEKEDEAANKILATAKLELESLNR